MGLDRYTEARDKPRNWRQLERRHAPGEKSSARREDPAPRMARKVDPDACPNGYDPEIWSLALLFEQIGRSYGHKSNGLPIIYIVLEQRINASGYRDKYSAPSKHEPEKLAWYWLLEQMITDWWDYEMDPEHPAQAIRDFCEPEEFGYVMGKIKDRCRTVKSRTPCKPSTVSPEVRQRRIDERKERIRRAAAL